MTNEKLKEFFADELSHAEQHRDFKNMAEDYYEYFNNAVEAYKWAIKALETHEGDLISRDAVKYFIEGHIHEIITESGRDLNAHTNSVLRAIINGVETMPSSTPQPKRDCDTCKHSAEQDGSNCYECVKGMADNFEAQPTDAVWRSDVEYIIKGSLCDLRRNEDKRIFINTLNSLPPVTPRTNLAETSQDCISRQAVLEGLTSIAKAKAKSDAQKSMMGRCMFFVEQLPPVTPQRPKGKWLHPYKSDIACECSECHIQMPITNYYHYCPNCGAEMSGGDPE